MQTSYTIPIAIVLGGIVVAVAVYFSIPKHSSISTDGSNPALVRPVSASDHVFGNPAAPVMIVEYADFNCDYCKGFDDTLHQIIATEGATGKVAWVFREFPLIEIHPDAMSHAQAAECAAQVAGNDAFWKFKDQLFAHQPVDPNQYGTLAQASGIPTDAFATCFTTATTTLSGRINADRQNALDIIGSNQVGTPYSLILVAGKAPVIMAGAYPYDAVKQLIDQALAK